ncbi:MAG: 3-hydroxyacyl-ACP dehydratase [Bacteroidetes bacterium]|nr:3-hydroxyacyl-ACP dehydratase [Bacteroidota bacterium]MBS1974252.1 3-hydroxyacyl-ACP dehydratase [Bacteroidota bacterium]
MVDKLTGCDEKSATSVFFIAGENILVEKGTLSEAGLIENIAQTAAARAGYIAKEGNSHPQIGYIGDVKNLEIKALPEINKTIKTEISIKNQIFDITIIEGRVTCGPMVLAQCEMKIFIPKQT